MSLQDISGQENSVYELALSFINNTQRSVFLTGKAGTGKTFFLKQIKNNTAKKNIIVAPTGVAAINAEGVTLHSLFNLPVMDYVPNRASLWETIRFTAGKTQLLQELELLIIDEVSMLRADILDAVDSILRKLRRQPEKVFGGLQMLFIGDLFQLAPITKDEDLQDIKSSYKSPFFIDAHAYAMVQPVLITLEKVYRQKDEAFVGLLNDIRIGRNDSDTLSKLNSFYKASTSNVGESILLTTHNRIADQINTANLENLPGEVYISDAIVQGRFDEADFPTDKSLLLKVGAHVMIVKNDKGINKQYYNGKVGVIEYIEEHFLTVQFSDGKKLKLEKEVWKKFDYSYTSSQDAIQQNEIGSFQQFPIRLAWAITIHKSQGLTLDHAVVDVAEAFLPGQVYVALSRLSSPAGLRLQSPVKATAISINPRILEFTTQQLSFEQIKKIYGLEKKAQLQKKILTGFDFSTIQDHLQQQNKKFDAENVYLSLEPIVLTLSINSGKFIKELMLLFQDENNSNELKVNDRIKAAVDFFTNEIESKFLRSLEKEKERVKSLSLQKGYLLALKDTLSILRRKMKGLNLIPHLVGEMYTKNERSIFSTQIKLKKSDPRKVYVKTDSSTVQSQAAFRSLTLFREGKSVQDIAEALMVTKDTIESYLSSFIATGEIEIMDLVNPDHVSQLLAILKGGSNPSILSLKGQVPECSFGQIKAVLHFFQTKMAKKR